MSQHITVVFGADREYETIVSDEAAASLPRDQARSWLSHEFETLECTPSNPMGKILVLDMILNVAKYGGEDRFKQGGDWAKQFAVATAVLLARPTVRIDVANFVVG